MRIPDYRNVHGVKNPNYWTPKTSRIDKTHQDEFEKELEESINKKKSEPNKKQRKTLAQDEKLDEMQSEVDKLFAEYEQKFNDETNVDLDDEIPKNDNRFSSWGWSKLSMHY